MGNSGMVGFLGTGPGLHKLGNLHCTSTEDRAREHVHESLVNHMCKDIQVAIISCYYDTLIISRVQSVATVDGVISMVSLLQNGSEILLAGDYTPTSFLHHPASDFTSQRAMKVTLHASARLPEH